MNILQNSSQSNGELPTNTEQSSHLRYEKPTLLVYGNLHQIIQGTGTLKADNCGAGTGSVPPSECGPPPRR